MRWTQLLLLANLILTRCTLLLDLIDILHKRSTAFTASLFFMHHLLGTLLYISTQTNLDWLTGSSKLVNTFTSLLDEEVVDLFQSQIGGFRIAVGYC